VRLLHRVAKQEFTTAVLAGEWSVMNSSDLHYYAYNHETSCLSGIGTVTLV
jgi:hypothetical protein